MMKKNWKTNLIGVMLFASGFFYKIDCLWLHLTGPCDANASYKIGGLLLAGVTFMLMPEQMIVSKLSKLADSLIGKFTK
jgi:hypothetical protein